MLRVHDVTGALATIAGLLAERGVGAASVVQSMPEDGDPVTEGSADGTATLVIGTHTAREADLSATVQALRESSVVAEVMNVLRLEGN